MKTSMEECFEECLKAFELENKKSMINMTLEERELYQICTQIIDHNVIMVDAEVLTPEKLAEAVKYLKKRQLKFVVLT